MASPQFAPALISPELTEALAQFRETIAPLPALVQHTTRALTDSANACQRACDALLAFSVTLTGQKQESVQEPRA